MYVVRPLLPGPGGEGGPGVVVAGGQEDGHAQAGEEGGERLDGLGPDAAAVEEVPGQQDEVRTGLGDGLGQPVEERALLLPPGGGLFGGQGVEGGGLLSEE